MASQTTSSSNPIKTPYDVTNQKIRVPAVSLWTSLFESLGAVPTSIPWDETHSALQRKLADGLDSTLAGIYFGKMYEVQKYVSRTNHIWDGFWLLADQRRFEALPAQHQSIIAKNIKEAAIKQRADVERLEAELQLELVARGLQFNDIIDTTEFRSKLSRSNFYRKWKEHFGTDAWTYLETTPGKLA